MLAELRLLDGILLIALGWLAIGFAGLAFPRKTELIGHVLFPIGTAGGLALALLALLGIGATPQALILPLGLPDLPFHLRLDALSAFFLCLLGIASTGISIYAAGYFRHSEGALPGRQCLLYHVFLASMVFVLLADDGYAFMVAWESMALSSFLASGRLSS